METDEQIKIWTFETPLGILRKRITYMVNADFFVITCETTKFANEKKSSKPYTPKMAVFPEI